MKNSKLKSYIKRLLIVSVIFAIPISIVWYGWVNTFVVIIPPDKYDSFPDGSIIWSYYDNRADRTISVDFIQEANVKSLLILAGIYISGDSRPMIFDYNERIHKFVSEGIGTSIYDLMNKEKPDIEQDVEPESVKPEIEKFDIWEDGEMKTC